MSFMLKKKRYRFHVDLCLEELSEVSYAKAVLFAKVRQIDGGTFTDVSKRKEVMNHRVQYNARFQFPCRMQAPASSGVLETCLCRISIRMEEKGGRHFRKVGYADLNLSEYAGAGPTTQRYILHPYDRSHRLDNSIVRVSVSVTLREGDTIFRRPTARQHPVSLLGGEAEDGGGTRAGGGAANKQAARPSSLTTFQNRLSDQPPSEIESHSRNSSSSTGYASSSQQQQQLQQQAAPAVAGHSRKSSSETTSSHARNLSQSSGDTGYYGSSLEKKRGATAGGGPHQRGVGGASKRLSDPPSSAHDGHAPPSTASAANSKLLLEEGRVDAETVIDELMAQARIGAQGEDDESVEAEGLQLYMLEDGSVTFNRSEGSGGVVVGGAGVVGGDLGIDGGGDIFARPASSLRE